MKKFLLLVTILPMLGLYGCSGGGGGGSSSLTGGDTGGNTGGGSSTAANLGNVAVYFAPSTAAALIDTDGLVRNAARLVATHYTELDPKCVDTITVSGEDEEGPYTLTECNDPFKEVYSNNGYPDIREVPQNANCSDPNDGSTCDPQWGPNPDAWEQQFGIKAEAISDTALESDGSGTAYLSVPEGADYTLHVLTYVSGTFNGSADTFTPVTPVIANTTNARIPMTASKRNLLLEYAQSDDPFDIVIGANTPVAITYETMAELVLPVDPVLSGDSYEVSAILSDALRETPWYVRTSVTEDDMATDWLIRETNETNTFSSGGNGKVTVNTVEIPAESNDPQSPDLPYTIWNHGQFFISDGLLADDEKSNWQLWTHGTTDAGELNSTGGVVISN